MVLHFLHDAIGLKDSRHLFIQSEVKPKPIVTRSHAFSRALRQPHVITSSFDWFNVLSVSYVIGQSNYFGFGFTTLKRKPLYYLFQFAYSKELYTLESFIVLFLSPQKLARLFLMRKVKRSPDRMMIKLLTVDNLFPPLGHSR